MSKLQFRYLYKRAIHKDKNGKYIWINRKKYYLKENYKDYLEKEPYLQYRADFYIKHKEVRKVIEEAQDE